MILYNELSSQTMLVANKLCKKFKDHDIWIEKFDIDDEYTTQIYVTPKRMQISNVNKLFCSDFVINLTDCSMKIIKCRMNYSDFMQILLG